MNEPTILLVTVVAWQRERILANEDVHAALQNAWEQADHWVVGRYVIMPDHVHLFCAPARHDRARVKMWCAYWKRIVGDLLPELKGKFEWDCWDTQMRTSGHYGRKLSYVANNPVRAGLVKEPGEWPYQGKMNPLWW